MNYRVALALLLAVSISTACSTGIGVHGQVMDGGTDKPLADTRVELFRCSASGCEDKVASRITGSDGRYALPQVAPGTYRLSITWEDPPCPGIGPVDTFEFSGEFVVSYFGYGMLGVPGQHRMVATDDLELETGRSVQLDLQFPCPQ